MTEMEEAEKKTFLKVEVAGKNKALWESSGIREKFMQLSTKIIDTVVNFEDNTTVGEEAKQISTELVKYAKEKLKRVGYENERIQAEIDEIYSRARKCEAETRKINAETRRVELETKLRELKLSIGIMKALLVGEGDEDSIVFVKKIDVLLEVLKDFEEA